MMEPWRRPHTAAPAGRLAERGVLLTSVLAMVVSAADSSGSPLWRAGFVAATFVSGGFVGVAWYRDDITTREVLFFAVLFRIVAFPLLPSLSDDGFRYVWDGWIQVSGINPYLFRPSDPVLTAFQDTELYSQLNSTNYYSVYPPSSQLVFALGGLIAVSNWQIGWYVIKVVLIGIELCGVWVLSQLVPPRSLLLYAWHPLVVVEVAGQAHTEAGMVGLLLLSFLAYRRGSASAAVASLTLAGWFKLYPLVLLPFLLRRVGWKHSWVAGGLSALLLLPYATPAALAHVAESLNLYVRLFEFNAGPYFLLKQFGIEWAGEDWSKTLGPVLRSVFLLGLAGLFLIDRSRRWPLAWVWLIALGLLWATATTVHPWYLLSILALLPFTLNGVASRAAQIHAAGWLWLSVAGLATYLFYTSGEAPYWTAVVGGWSGWAIAMAWAAALYIMPKLMRKRASDKWRWVRPHVGAPSRLLDLGAGEGFVGDLVARHTPVEVVLADVVDFNQTQLPLVLYDGRRLPLENQSFDVTLLIFVLHHSEDPTAVLREVRRVTRGRVVVVESIVENEVDRRWLPFADRMANRMRSGGRMRDQEDHLHFNSAPGWRNWFAEAGFRIVAEHRRGRWFHKQHLFVLE